MEEKKFFLGYTAFIRKKDTIYFSNNDFNGLFKINLQDFTTEFVRSFPMEDGVVSRDAWMHFYAVLEIESKIIFFPNLYDRIFIYDVDKKTAETIIIPGFDEKKYHVGGVARWGDKIWIFPTITASGIYIWNFSKDRIEKDCEISRILNEYENITNIVQIKNHVLFGIQYTDVIFEYDLEKSSIQKRVVPVEGLCMCNISVHGDKCWITQVSSTTVYEWNIKDNGIKEYKCEMEDIDSVRIPFSLPKFVEKADSLFIPGSDLPYIMKIDLKKGKIEKAFELPLDVCADADIPFFSSIEIVGDELWCHPIHGNAIVIYNMQTGGVTAKEVAISQSDLMPIFEEEFTNKEVYMWEKNTIPTLEQLIETEVYTDIVLSEHTSSIGEKIYEAIFKE